MAPADTGAGDCDGGRVAASIPRVTSGSGSSVAISSLSMGTTGIAGASFSVPLGPAGTARGTGVTWLQ